MRISAVVQARMGSSRLPGKVLMDIGGRAMLWRVVNRLQSSQFLNQVIIATSTSSQDDAVEAFCRHEGIAFFRGSETDVLARFYQAADQFGVDHIVRITADCPLIDAPVIDRVITAHLQAKGDYTSNTLKRSFPRGMDTEVFTRQALNLAQTGAIQAADREHVTPYFYNHPELFKLVSVLASAEFCRPDVRLCVDTPADLELVRKIFSSFSDSLFHLGEVIRLLNERPDWLKINADVKQKTI